MARQPKDKPRFDQDELEKLLRDYWLTTGEEPMAEVIALTLNAHCYNHEITLLHEKGPVVNLLPTLDALGIIYTSKWLREDEDGELPVGSVRVPSMAERREDFELLLPFFSQRILQELNKQAMSPKIKVEPVFLMFLESQLKRGLQTLYDLLKWWITPPLEKGGTMYGVVKEEPLGELSERFYDEIRGLPFVAFMYLGLHYYRLDPHHQMELESGNLSRIIYLRKHPFNDIARHVLYKDVRSGVRQPDRQTVSGVAIRGGDEKSSRRYPVVKTITEMPIEQIGLVAKNLTYLREFSVEWLTQDPDNKGRRCLELRLEGLKEHEIRGKLGFRKKSTYDKFLAENHIDITIGKRRDILRPAEIMKRWEQARDKLFEGHEDSESELVELLGPVDKPKTDLSDAPDSISIGTKGLLRTHSLESHNSLVLQHNITFSGDYRSATQEGQTFTFTPAQSAALKHLNQNFPQYVSSAYIFAEISNDFDFKTPTLRKLFEDNETAFDALVEKKGKKKDALYRLRPSEVPSQ